MVYSHRMQMFTISPISNIRSCYVFLLVSKNEHYSRDKNTLLSVSYNVVPSYPVRRRLFRRFLQQLQGNLQLTPVALHAHRS